MTDVAAACCVIFDLGGVVLRWDPDALLERFYAEPATRALVKQEILKHPDWLELDRGTLAEADAIVHFQQRSGRPLAELRQLFQAIKDSLEPMPDTLDLIEDLVRARIPLYCLSNMPAEFFVQLRERHAFFDRFTGVVISSHVNLIKPDPAIFEHIQRRFSLVPAATVFIDDMQANIESAARQGFRTVHFADARQCRTELSQWFDALPAAAGGAQRSRISS